MPWLKAGDNAATYPAVLRAGVLGDSVNEVFGFVMRCALQSAAHTTDYWIDEGVAFMLGGPDTERLVKAATRAKLLKAGRRDGGRGWMLVEDPEFLHMRTAEEIAWEKQQAADSSNPGLTVPVRLRDGDSCRYCRKIVQWSARRGGRAGTYDHLQPGQPARTPADLVVACGGCNSARRDRDNADELRQLHPPPAEPYYSASTITWLARHGKQIPTTQRPATTADTAHASDPATSGTTRAAEASDPATDTATTSDRTAPSGTAPRSADRPGSAAQKTWVARVGSGRDGTGLAGTGRARDGTGAPPKSSRKRRSRRGRPRTAGDR